MDWSIEILPKQENKFKLLPKFVEEIYIPILPGSDHQNLIPICKSLIKFGKIPVPHIAARAITSERAFLDLLEGLAKAKVDRVLLIGGSSPHTIGPYSSVIKLLETGWISDYGIRIIDIAGHPEGNPYDPDAEEHLINKVLWASTHNISMRIITQWSFNPLEINAWIQKMRKNGVSIPIHIGIPGPAKMKTLLHYAKICGVRASAQVLQNQGFNQVKMLLINKPDQLIDQLEGYDRLHLFTFGGLTESAKWLNKFRLRQI